VAATAAANVTLVGSAGSLKPDRPVLWRRPAAIETQATKAKINVERRLRSGDYVMSVWVGEDMVTYRAVRGTSGWGVFKNVAGAERTTTLNDPCHLPDK
jgi:hypothetical protein